MRKLLRISYIRNRNFFFIILFCYFFLYACISEKVFDEKYIFSNNVWNVDEVPEFKVSIGEIRQSYNVYLNLTNTKEFKTNNIWLFFSVISPSGSLLTDTVQFFITDNAGRWYGNKDRNFIKNKFLYKKNIGFPETGTYTFKIKQGMREKDTPLVKSVGLTLEKEYSDDK